MRTTKEIRESCSKEIAELQQVCDHSEKQWMLYSWADGHFTGKICLVCLLCEKELDSEELPIEWLHYDPVTVDDKGVWYLPESHLEKYIKEKNKPIGRC